MFPVILGVAEECDVDASLAWVDFAALQKINEEKKPERKRQIKKKIPV